ncbi:MAG TPA: hypothetical protein VF540_03330 [Segetibacter sp.]
MNSLFFSICLLLFGQFIPAEKTTGTTGRTVDAASEQYILVDTIFEYKEDGYTGDVYKKSKPFQNWLTPNYKDGEMHVRVEVLEKPNDTTTSSILCRICSGPHHDRTQNRRFGIGKVLFNRKGVYHFSFPVSDGVSLTQPDHFKWDSSYTLIQVVCADPKGQMVSKWENDLGTFAGFKADYLPLKVRYTAILVPKNQRFKKPKSW